MDSLSELQPEGAYEPEVEIEDEDSEYESDTFEEESDTLEYDSGTLEEESDTLEEESDTLEEDSDTLEEDSDFLEEDSDFLEEDSDPMEEDSDTIEQEEHFQARPTIRIVMPDNLKALLVDDWERVTKNFSVVKLPAPRPIREILQAYRADEVPQRNRFDLQVLDTNLAGLTEYFEVAIGKVLLYNYERHQYRLLRKKYKGIKGKSPVNIFGAEHLIRMFSNLGELLAQTNLGYQSTGRVQREVSKLAIWLSHRSDTYFRTAYIPAYGLTSDDV